MDTMDTSTTPLIKAKSPEYKNLMSLISNSSSEPQTVTKPRRRRKKGNNWTRKKHTLRSPTQTPIVSPTPSPEIKQEEYENHSSSEVKGSGTLWNIHDDSNMDIRRAAVERDFGLRPDLGIMDRPKMPVKSIEKTESLSSEESPSLAKPLRIAPRKGVQSILPTPETQEHDRSPATPSPNHREELTTFPNDNSVKRRHSNSSQTSDGSLIIPFHFPPNPVSRPDRAADLFWLNACMQVQRPDGTVHAPEVIVWLMTRKGGMASSWPRLEEGLTAVEMMGKDTIDPAEILRRQAEEEAIARAKEERRLANKRRYRPRGQIDKERVERRAALAAQKAQELEKDGADYTPNEDRVDDLDQILTKKTKIDTDIQSDLGRQPSNEWTEAQ
ncbi:hypothetical protein FLAG1_00944 [Fusarium langsethiae]|uniref:Uncharacterized protein n=1 Tax=Fusarium langsethiae TaxID=179993 RepID=A0A0M9F4R1_FUSLA|nr:hypothetical protein FLAG1_00944 [Fusarium langsethiae]GKT98221.1 unnamed protein product [Fusarium langsethiae]GKU12848.1 unnamed protein product [Fusarium langsethiae]